MEFRKDDVTKVFLLLRGFAEWSEIFQILAFNLYEFQNTKDYLGYFSGLSIVTGMDYIIQKMLWHGILYSLF